MNQEKWIVLWKDNQRLGLLPMEDAVKRHFDSMFYMSLLMVDSAGTEHWDLMGIKDDKKIEKFISHPLPEMADYTGS